MYGARGDVLVEYEPPQWDAGHIRQTKPGRLRLAEIKVMVEGLSIHRGCAEEPSPI